MLTMKATGAWLQCSANALVSEYSNCYMVRNYLDSSSISLVKEDSSQLSLLTELISMHSSPESYCVRSIVIAPEHSISNKKLLLLNLCSSDNQQKSIQEFSMMIA